MATASKPLKLALVAAVCACTAPAMASNWRLGVSLGFGGTGIQQQRDLAEEGDDPLLVTVKRANGPGTVGVVADYLLTRNISVTVDHARGFSLGPFSSGVTFTGLGMRYYISPPQSASSSSTTDTVMRVKRFVFFVGAGAGVATGSVFLEGDQVPTVSSSGIYVAGRGGAEYLISPNFGIRPEVVYATTLISQSVNPAVVNQFSIQCGLFFFL